MAISSNPERERALALADLFKDTVESFGIFHQHKDTILLTKLGIQQARLLAWGLHIGICELKEDRRSSHLDEAGSAKFHSTLRALLDKLIDKDPARRLKLHGLVPSSRMISTLEPAVAYARLEVVRERYSYLGVRRHRGATAIHWQLEDEAKFDAFIDEVAKSVDSLIESTGNSDDVVRAVQSDIKTLGWHPLGQRRPMAADSRRLRKVRDACATTYPEFSEMATAALANIEREWQDLDSADADNVTTEIPFAATRVERMAENQKSDTRRAKPKKSIFTLLRSPHWRRNKPQRSARANSVANPEQHHSFTLSDNNKTSTDQPRSKSLDAHGVAGTTEELHYELPKAK